MKLKFCGAAGTVTGSRYLLTREGAQILVDWGLFQGQKQPRQGNWDELDAELIKTQLLRMS